MTIQTQELIAPITWKDEAKRIVYGPVLIPDEPDSDGDVVSADKIEQVAHKFLEEYGLMENMHTLQSVARPVESFLAPADISLGPVTVPKGSWVVGARVHDDGAWGDVMSGKLGGFSIVAVPTVAIGKDASTKRLTLRDIEKSGKDWDVIAIGLVDQPAVPLAKWTAIKAAPPATPTIVERLKDLIAPKSAGLNQPDEAQLREIREAASNLVLALEGQTSTKEEDSMSEITIEQLQEAVGEAVKPLTERIDALEASGQTTEKNEDGTNNGASESDSGITKEELEAALTAASQKGAEEAVASILTKFEEHLEKTPRPSTKGLATSLRGQDGHEASPKKAEDTRDPWGRLVKS